MIIGCWLILCQVAELLATYQISKSDIQNLFLKLQKTPTHLVRQENNNNNNGLHYDLRVPVLPVCLSC